MTSDLLARDILAYSAQVAAIVTTGAVVWRLFGVRRAVITHFFWRALLLLCLMLPFVQEWRTETSLPVAVATTATVEAGSIAPTGTGSTIAAATRWLPPLSVALVVCLAAGAVVRTLWLVWAAVGLRRLRRDAVRLEPAPPVLREAQARIGVRADICVSDHVAGPVTFGFRRPVVMLPPAVLTLDDELQRAIATHELLHVRRHDWLAVIGEELIRTVFWFHPAVWWLIGRIQLSREHVVDEAVIDVTRSRDRYVEALVAVALNNTGETLAPAPLFLRRRFLKRRVAHILEETAMTTRRLIASLALSAPALYLAAALAVRTFPLEAHAVQPETAARAEGEQAKAAAETPLTQTQAMEQLAALMDRYRRLETEFAKALKDAERHAALAARYKQLLAEYEQRHVQSDVEQQTEKLRQKLVEAAENEKAAQESAITERQRRELRQRLIEVELQLERLRYEKQRVEKGVEDEQLLALLSVPRRLTAIETARVPEEMVTTITSRVGIAIGDAVTYDTALRVRGIVSASDQRLRVSFRADGDSGIVLRIATP